MSDLLQKGFEAVAKGLREFGYPDVSAGQIASAHEKWRAGQELTDVIEMFAERDFNEHPEIFGTPEGLPDE